MTNSETVTSEYARQSIMSIINTLIEKSEALSECPDMLLTFYKKLSMLTDNDISLIYDGGQQIIVGYNLAMEIDIVFKPKK